MLRKVPYEETMSRMVFGEMSADDAVQFLRAQNVRGVSTCEVLKTIEVLEGAYQKNGIACPPYAVNVVGTGRTPGASVSGEGRFSGISSATAVVLAAMGMFVLKHGGRGGDGLGSASFFEHVSTMTTLRKSGMMIFVRAGAMLPPYVGVIRAQMQEGTVFNLAFPFAAPFVGHERMRFVGVSGGDKDYNILVAVACAYLRRTRSPMTIVVYQGKHGVEDRACFGEVSPFGATNFTVVTRHNESRGVFHPEQFGLELLHREEFGERCALSPQDFLRMMRNTHEWSARDFAYADMIARNVAFVLMLCMKRKWGVDPSNSFVFGGYNRAHRAMRSGGVWRFLRGETGD